MIHFSTFLHHLHHTRFWGHQKAMLMENPKKCYLWLTEAQYLGYHIGCGLLMPQKKKVEAMREHPHPTTMKQVLYVLFGAGWLLSMICA